MKAEQGEGGNDSVDWAGYFTKVKAISTLMKTSFIELGKKELHFTAGSWLNFSCSM